MSKITFGKYINNNSILTKIDARFKIIMMVILLIFCFLNFNIVGMGLLFILLLVLMLIGKLSLRPLINIVRHMWFLFLFLFIINLLTIKGEILFELFNGVYIYKDAIYQTIYIFLRIVMILMVSTLLSASTTPSELTYGLEFYLKPLRVFKINVYELAIMISIALRFIPTLIEEMEKIKKSQTSRGVDFENGKYSTKLKALTSLIIPIFISCFEKADELTNAMIARGYNSELKRSKYKHLSVTSLDFYSSILLVLSLITILVLNGVLL